jgi:hypothetical protein
MASNSDVVKNGVFPNSVMFASSGTPETHLANFWNISRERYCPGYNSGDIL